MKYIDGFLSARLNDADKNRKIGKEVEKGNCEFSHFAMDRCYYRPIRSKRDIAEINTLDQSNEALLRRHKTKLSSEFETLDQAIEKQKSFINGTIKENN
jgi:hypothetical protein